MSASPGSRTGPLHVDLPTLTGIDSFEASVPEITCPADPAALQPIAVPLAASLSAVLAFSDGKQRTILDDRAVVSVAPDSQAHCSIDRDAQGHAASVVAATPSCAAADCVITLAYPSLNASVSANVTVSIVVAEAVQAFLQPLDAPPECAASVAQQPAPPATLHPIVCSGADYQQLTVCALARLSTSRVAAAVRSFDVTQHCSFELSGAAAWALRPNLHNVSVSNRLRPLAAGNNAVQATFGSLGSASIALRASGIAAAVSAVEVAWTPAQAGAACGQQCSSTFAAQRNTQHPLDVSIVLTDGYTYSVLAMRHAANATMDVLDVPNVLAFASSEPGVIAMGPRGLAQLTANAAGALQLEARTTCTTDSRSLASDVDVYGNLQPGALDVDIGSPFGPALQGGGAKEASPQEIQVRHACAALRPHPFSARASSWRDLARRSIRSPSGLASLCTTCHRSCRPVRCSKSR